MNTYQKVVESNRIEGILRKPTIQELRMHELFMQLHIINIHDLEAFVSIYQPDARLRSVVGMDIHIGAYVPPLGGPQIPELLQKLLDDVNGERVNAFRAHHRYESLHPFSDGNGRSGRVLWYWMMQNDAQFANADELGFLHTFYYQTLRMGEP
jgi:fido (protein-threonine AMPylation protein)